MKICDVRAMPMTYDDGDSEPVSLCFVAVETDGGGVGIGEATDGVGCRFAGTLATLVDEALRPLLVGEEPLGVEPLVRKMRGWTRRRLGDEGVVIQAIGAVEIALWDIVSRSLGLSVSALHGRFRDHVPVYVSGLELGGHDPGRLLEQLAPCLECGVAMVKFVLGTQFESGLETLTALRDRLGSGVSIAVDGAECFTVPTALQIARELARLDVAWFEAPVPRHHRAALHHLAERSAVPIAAGAHVYGRHGYQALLSDVAVSVVQPDASLGGGLSDMRAASALAEYYGVRVVPRASGGPVAMVANLHLAASVATARLVEYRLPLVGLWSAVAPTVDLGIDALHDGGLRVPTGPGLGVAIDAAVVDEHAFVAPGHHHPMPSRMLGDR